MGMIVNGHKRRLTTEGGHLIAFVGPIRLASLIGA